MREALKGDESLAGKPLNKKDASASADSPG
jgi:hypothetical protein